MSQNLSSAAVVIGALRANMDLDIALYCCGSQVVFFTMEFHKEIIRKFSYDLGVKLSLHNMILHRAV